MSSNTDAMLQDYLSCCRAESKLKQSLSKIRANRQKLEPQIMQMLDEQKLNTWFVSVDSQDRDAFGGYGMIEMKDKVGYVSLGTKKVLQRLLTEYFLYINQFSSLWADEASLVEFVNKTVNWLWENREQRIKTQLVRTDLEQRWDDKMQSQTNKPRGRKPKSNTQASSSSSSSDTLVNPADGKQPEQKLSIRDLSFQAMQDVAEIAKLPFWQSLKHVSVSDIPMSSTVIDTEKDQDADVDEDDPDYVDS